MAGTDSTPRSVLFVHHGDQWIRGSERCLIDHITHLDPRRFRPVLWTNCGPLADMMRARGIPVTVGRFSLILDYRSRFNPAEYFRLIRMGTRLIRSYSVSIVHCNAGMPSQWMVPAARWARVPVIVQPHNNPALRSRCVQLIHQSTAIVGVCEAIVAHFREDGVPTESLRVIHNTVDAARLRGQPPVTRDALGVDSRTYVFAAVGALIPIKGLDILLRSFARVELDYCRPLLLIIGEGPERQRLEALAVTLRLEERVRFLGNCPNAPALMRDITDAVVMSSHDEVFPLVLLEAGFFSRPCIAPKVGGIPEILKDEESGLLVPPGDVAALGAAMQRLAADSSLGVRLGAQLKRQMTDQLLSPAGTRQLETLYDECIAKLRNRKGKAASVRWYPAYTHWLKRSLSTVRRRVFSRARPTRIKKIV